MTKTPRALDKASRLGSLTAQASSLSALLYGEGGETFRNYNDTIQDNVLWLLSDLLREIDGIVNGGPS